MMLRIIGLALLGISIGWTQEKPKEPAQNQVETLQKELADQRKQLLEEQARSRYLAARATRDELHSEADKAVGGRLSQAEQAEQQAAQELVKQLACPADRPFNAQTLACSVPQPSATSTGPQKPTEKPPAKK